MGDVDVDVEASEPASDGVAAAAAATAARHRMRRAAIVVASLVAIIAVVTFAGAPLPGGLRRYPAGDLIESRDYINQTCGRPVATVDWIRGRVITKDFAPVDLTPERRRMTIHTGAKVGCIAQAVQ